METYTCHAVLWCYFVVNDFLEGLCDQQQFRNGRVTVVAAAIPETTPADPDRMPRRKQDCPKRMKCKFVHEVPANRPRKFRKRWKSFFVVRFRKGRFNAALNTHTLGGGLIVAILCLQTKQHC